MADPKVPLPTTPASTAITEAKISKKRAVLYARVSTGDQHPETQLYDLRTVAKQRGFEIVGEYTDVISGAKSKRPGVDWLLSDARRGHFEVVLVAAFDRVARSVRHFLEVLDELNHLGLEFVSVRESIARLEGRQIERRPLSIDREQVVVDRCSGMSLTQVSKKQRIPARTR